MLVSTFDTFDIILAPSNYGELMGVVFLLLPLLFLNVYWVRSPARIWPHLTALLSSIVNRTSGHLIGGMLAFLLVFWNILLPLNEFGLIPFRFPVRSHMSMTFAVRVGLWGSIVFLGVSSSYYHVTSHLMPSGVGALGPFMVMVELVRSLVRPLTLAFRLAANITAGHVILGLAALITSRIRGFGSVRIIIPILYYAFEVIIRWVQAYVFLLLVIFYTNDYVDCWASLIREYMICNHKVHKCLTRR